MNPEVFLFLIAIIPFGMAVINQHKLKDKQVFLSYLKWTSLVVIIGIVYEFNQISEAKSLSYFLSQMGLLFILSYKLVRIPYYHFFKREPEISEYGEYLIDIIPTILVLTATVTLPFIIDDLIIRKLFESRH